MTYDSFVAAAIAAEARSTILTSWVDVVHQPEERLVTLGFFGRGGKTRWAFSADARRAGVWRTQRKRPNPPTAPAFCMLLRKYLDGARLIGVETAGVDRVLRWRFERSDIRVSLVAEVMGKHSNLILLNDQEQILGAIKPVPARVSRVRQVLPGLVYQPPPAVDRVDPRALTRQAFLELVEGAVLDPDWIVKRLAGFGPFAARELLARAGAPALPEEEDQHRPMSVPPEASAPSDGAMPTPEAVWEALAALMADVAAERFQPVLLRDAAGRPEGFWVFLPRQRPDAEPAPSLSAAIETVFDAALAEETEAAERRELRERVRAALERAERQCQRVEEDLAGERRAEQWRIDGELLAANLHRVRRGDTSVEVVDYYDPEQKLRLIPLDPELTPQENVERLFRRHRKGIDAALMALEQADAVRARRQALAALRERIEAAAPEELPALRRELETLQVLREGPTVRSGEGDAADRRAAKPAYPPGVRIRTVTVDGWELLYGENATSNDFLTTKVARPDDWWLHVRAAASAHVVIRTGGRPERVPPRVLEEAARLAAAHSESKHAGLVPVDYVLKKYVRKPRASGPGRVTYQNEKTLFISPTR